MLERPPGGTTIRRPAGLMGMSSGVGGPGQAEKGRDIKTPVKTWAFVIKN